MNRFVPVLVAVVASLATLTLAVSPAFAGERLPACDANVPQAQRPPCILHIELPRVEIVGRRQDADSTPVQRQAHAAVRREAPASAPRATAVSRSTDLPFVTQLGFEVLPPLVLGSAKVR